MICLCDVCTQTELLMTLLRSGLPVINGEVAKVLSNIVDFDVYPFRRTAAS